MVNLNQIDKATEEDRKYGIDHWARLFKADTWEAIKKMAQENEYISGAAQTMFESSQDISIRTFCEGVEEAHRLRRGLEIRLERAEAALQAKNDVIAEKDEVLAKKDAEIARLKALLASK